MKKATILIGILACLIVVVRGAEKKDITKVDMEALVRECQRSTSHTRPTDGMNFVWWLPAEYIQAAIADEGKAFTAGHRAMMVREFGPNLVLAIVRTDVKMEQAAAKDNAALVEASLPKIKRYISESDTLRFHDKQSVQDNLRVTYVDAKGVRHVLERSGPGRPGIGPEFAVDMIRPLLSPAMGGGLGMKYHFLGFKNRDAKGKQIVSPYAKGKLVVELKRMPGNAGGIVEFECPLNSLYVPRRCAKCAKKAHVRWNYCPWCGTKFPA